MLGDILKVYDKILPAINSRFFEFRRLWEEGDETKLFAELSFCLLTPQSRARICWKAVENLMEDGTLFRGTCSEIVDKLRGVRFRKNKACYIVLARELFSGGGTLSIRERLLSLGSPFSMREWLVGHVKGMGYKEASHFLRNIYIGRELAILDRHILKILFSLGVIEEFPKTLSKRRYLYIEARFKDFSEEVGVPVSHLDFVLWYMATGDIFK